jgi:hypothetical protein
MLKSKDYIMIASNCKEETIEIPYFCEIANEAIYIKYNFIQFTESPILQFVFGDSDLVNFS